ncbi:hypothetical protein CROQUDRAFT_718031 [Cronartium quercuum f. sp. fusiforme G11]|uniref:Uncharacterized protein n=1 Tax=Cronartium quercuum f. sp. fusiforme G11 TaxID=708437 RepID=A0A9P6NDG9_9BASI|nr:hypothetical protein CROQUDRAFT_718031 [Cronartium quercuum f. sp. fusiforme G11]
MSTTSHPIPQQPEPGSVRPPQTSLANNNSLASDAFSQEFKEVEAHLANSLPDFFTHSSATRSDDPSSRKRKLGTLGSWDMSHTTPKRTHESSLPASDNRLTNSSYLTQQPGGFTTPSNTPYAPSDSNVQAEPLHRHRNSNEPVLLHPPSRQDQVASLLTAYLKNPVNPVVGQSLALSRLAPLAQVSAFGSTENIRQAVLTGLAHSGQSKQTPAWARERPTRLEGPFLCLGGAKTGGEASGTGPGTETKVIERPMIYGPVDPNLLDPQTVIAVYYACYPTHSDSPPAFDFDLEVLDPVLGGTPLITPAPPPASASSVLAPPVLAPPVLAPSAPAPLSSPEPVGPAVHLKNPHTLKRNSVPSMTPEQINSAADTAVSVDPFKVPEVDMSARKRAPRKCGVCGQYYCKGRGNRSLCPSFVPGRDEPPPAWRPAPRPKEEEQGPTNGDISVHTPTRASHDPQWNFGNGGELTPDDQTQPGNGPSSAENSRKRGPRRCAVCQLLGCPGNGNRRGLSLRVFYKYRKLCNRAHSVPEQTPTLPPIAATHTET